MNEDITKLVNAFMDPAMTGEGRASVLGYARGRLDAQREMGVNIENFPAGLEKGRVEGNPQCKN
jgi:hypothetical protein